MISHTSVFHQPSDTGVILRGVICPTNVKRLVNTTHSSLGAMARNTWIQRNSELSWNSRREREGVAFPGALEDTASATPTFCHWVPTGRKKIRCRRMKRGL